MASKKPGQSRSESTPGASINSQNTTWFREHFHCSICRPLQLQDDGHLAGLIAQRIAWTCGWFVAFHEATVIHERNEHDLLKDFSDEIVDTSITGDCHDLQKLNLKPGVDAINDNLITCYTMMIDRGHIGIQEMGMLKAVAQRLPVRLCPDKPSIHSS